MKSSKTAGERNGRLLFKKQPRDGKCIACDQRGKAVFKSQFDSCFYDGVGRFLIDPLIGAPTG
jgi:hypothetical protein